MSIQKVTALVVEVALLYTATRSAMHGDDGALKGVALVGIFPSWVFSRWNHIRKGSDFLRSRRQLVYHISVHTTTGVLLGDDNGGVFAFFANK